ncbi:NF-kappa-B-repressing factor-like [Chironomus tepperi]|uniref:NF-kappa-B-repressing factor-like n=1 Tax=Chironomus tepperi TaxID=113505 RepID=UPI00391F183A
MTSSKNSNKVDFNVYRKEYESTDHWNLRKSFMMHHWDKINDEEEVLCCAQLFVNIEFLGCRYAAEIMRKIKLMSDEVPEIRKYRESRQNKLKRTFVTAQDAIQAKYNKTTPKTDEGNKTFKPNNYQTDINNSFVPETSHAGSLIKLSESTKSKNLKTLLRDVIVFENDEENDMNYCLNKTTADMRKIGKLDINFDEDTTTYYYIFNDQIIAEGTGESKKVAKAKADENFIKVLRENCYTIRSKLKFYSGQDIIKKTGNKPVNEISNQIQEGNLGFKLLSKLGWKGGSLGSKGSGIIDPINLEIKIGRLGLGSENNTFDQKYFRNLLQNFKHNQLEYDLIFSSEFTKEERASIHQMAGKLNLRTKSYGKDGSRHLVISTRINPQVLRQKLIDGDEYLREKYELIPPSHARPNTL